MFYKMAGLIVLNYLLRGLGALFAFEWFFLLHFHSNAFGMIHYSVLTVCCVGGYVMLMSIYECATLHSRLLGRPVELITDHGTKQSLDWLFIGAFLPGYLIYWLVWALRRHRTAR